MILFYHLTGPRAAHIHATADCNNDADILAAAIKARTDCVGLEVPKTRAMCEHVNDLTRHDRVSVIFSGSTAFPPVNVGRRTKNRRVSVRRGFQFTIEGRDGVFKIEGGSAFHRIS